MPNPSEAALAGLRWSSDDEPGLLRRERRGKQVLVEQTSGRVVTTAAVTGRVASLAIPPAWTDVWICADPRGHIQAVGKDAKGRKQYRYHPMFRAHREATKFAQLPVFADALGGIRARCHRELARQAWDRDRVAAIAVTLLERTLIRVGNSAYASSNHSYGLTTLRNKHASVRSDNVHFRFRGKSGVVHDVSLRDRRLATIVKRLQDLPGQQLLEYVDDHGTLRPLTSGDVNDFLREVSGADVTAKTFRTWSATVHAAEILANTARPSAGTRAASTLKAVMVDTAKLLGNTPTVARASYVHPRVVDVWRDDQLAELWRSGPRRPAAGLTTSERRTRHILTA
jgi:DNA topoisomerase I